MAVDIHSDRRFRFDVDRATVWAAVVRVDRYRAWWPWLDEFDGSSFCEGATWRCVVEPPVPYALRFVMTLVDVVDGERVSAVIDGDIAGRALLTATDLDPGCELRLVSDLRAASGALEVVTRRAPSVASFGHDWVLDAGARRFRRQAFDR